MRPFRLLLEGPFPGHAHAPHRAGDYRELPGPITEWLPSAQVRYTPHPGYPRRQVQSDHTEPG